MPRQLEQRHLRNVALKLGRVTVVPAPYDHGYSLVDYVRQAIAVRPVARPVRKCEAKAGGSAVAIDGQPAGEGAAPLHMHHSPRAGGIHSRSHPAAMQPGHDLAKRALALPIVQQRPLLIPPLVRPAIVARPFQATDYYRAVKANVVVGSCLPLLNRMVEQGWGKQEPHYKVTSVRHGAAHAGPQRKEAPSGLVQ